MTPLVPSARAKGLVSRRLWRSAMTGGARREALQGFAFISPWMVGFLAFTLMPLAMAIYYGFTDFSLLAKPNWLGTYNYERAFTDDPLFWKSVGLTFQWVGITVPLGIVGSLLAAVALNRGVRGTGFWRTCFFLPSLTPQVAAGALWLWLLNKDIGLINLVLREFLSLPGGTWLSSPATALPTLAMVSLWTDIGSNRMLIFLAALQGVPEELYDAAAVDGATGLRKLLNVTLPMISPSILLNMILSIIGSMQVFGLALMSTNGGPAYATYFYAMHMYYTSFRFFEMGYGCALACLFFVVILILTTLQLWLSQKWVYYSGEH